MLFRDLQLRMQYRGIKVFLKKQSMVVFCSICLLIILSNPIFAKIEGKVSQITYANGKEEVSDKTINSEISALFTNDEKITTLIDSEGKYLIDPSSMYCWNSCNIFPIIYLKKLGVYNSGELISKLVIPYSNMLPENEQNVFLAINVFETDKLYKEDTETFQNIDNDEVSSVKIGNISDKTYYSVLWNGSLSIDESSEYSFYINVSGSLKVWLNDEIMAERDDATEEEISFEKNLETGSYNLKIEYYTSEDYAKPNIFWSKDNFDKQVIPNSDLHFYSGGAKKVSVDKFYSTRAFALLASRPTYPNADWYTYYGINISKRPILFVHGWSNSENPDLIGGGWNSTIKKLEEMDNEAIEIVYDPANLNNTKNAGVLSYIINDIKSVYPVSKIDVVSHSMGGLVVRGYIQNLGVDELGNPKLYNEDIRKYVIIASPMFGTYFASLVNNKYDFNWVCDFLDWWLLHLNQISEATYNMEKGSQFTWDLNYQPLNLNVDYLTIGGFKDFAIFGFRVCGANVLEWDDGVVSLRSANLLKYNVPFIVVDQNHLDIHKTEQTANIINSFIKGENTNKTKSYLKSDEYYIDPDDSDADANPYTVGDALIKFTGFEDIKSVAFKAPSKYYNLTKNNRTNIWYYLYFENANDFTTSVPVGMYDVLVNLGQGLIDTDYDIEIRASETTLLEVIRDSDNDGLPDDKDACPNEKGTWCHGCPQPVCGLCAETSCPSPPLVAPHCFASSSSTLCNSGYKCSFGAGDNYYNIGGEYLCQGFCDGNYNCDYANSCSYNSDCDPDDDNDGIDDTIDNCPKIVNSKQEDLDGDGKGDSCDEDVDGDGYNSTTDCNDMNFSIHPKAIEICENGIDEDCDGKDLECYTIYSPKTGNYSYDDIKFNLTLVRAVPYLKYIDYSDNRSSAKTLCRNCNESGFTRKKEINFDDGYHNVNIFSTDGLINETISFFVDSTKPRVSSQEPRNRDFCNGNFTVKYSEEYPLSVNLHYGANQVMPKQDCPAGRNQECKFNVSVEQYEGQWINFHFEVEDLFWQIPYRRNHSCLVDTTPPHITHLNLTVDGRYLYLNISLDDEARYLKYIDYNDTRPREMTLCSRCDEYGASRVKRKSFRTGDHTIEIIAEDEAENRDISDRIFFEVV